MCGTAVAPIPFGNPSLTASPSFAQMGSTANMGCAVGLPTVKKNCLTGEVHKHMHSDCYSASFGTY